MITHLKQNLYYAHACQSVYCITVLRLANKDKKYLQERYTRRLNFMYPIILCLFALPTFPGRKDWKIKVSCEFASNMPFNTLKIYKC